MKKTKIQDHGPACDINLTDKDNEIFDRYTPYFYRQGLVTSYRNFDQSLPKPLIGPNNKIVAKYLNMAYEKGFDLVRLVHLRDQFNRHEKRDLFQPLRFDLEIRPNIATDPLTEKSKCEFWIQIGKDIPIVYIPEPENVDENELVNAKTEWQKQYKYLYMHLGQALIETAYELCNEMTGVHKTDMDALAFSYIKSDKAEISAGRLILDHGSYLMKRLEGYTRLYVGVGKKKLRYSKAEMNLLIELYDYWLPVLQRARKTQLAYRGDDWREAVLKACPELPKLPMSAVGRMALMPGLIEIMESLAAKHKPHEALKGFEQDTELQDYLTMSGLKILNTDVLNWLGERKEETRHKAYRWKPMHIAYVYSARCVSVYLRDAKAMFPDMSQWKTIQREVEIFKKEQPQGDNTK